MSVADYVYETDEQRDPTRIADGNLRVLTVTLLGVLIAVSFLGNLFLVATVWSSVTLKQLKFYIFLANLAVVNLADTAANMFLSLLYVAAGTWPFADYVCPLNAFLVDLLALQAVAGIGLLAVDRALALYDLKHYTRRMSTTTTAVGLGAVWAIGICFTVPIAIDSIHSKVFPARYLCAVAPESPLAYTALLVCVHVFVWLVLLVSFGLILWRAHQDRVGVRPNQYNRHDRTHSVTGGQQMMQYNDEQAGNATDRRTMVIMEHRHFHAQLDLGKFAVLLFVVYFVLQGPYLFLNSITQMRNSAELLPDQYDGVVYVVPADAETSLTWLKFIYPVTFPFLVFIFCPDIWIKFSALVCCRRTSVVTSSAVDRHVPLNELQSPFDAPAHPNVITLVGTANGLHTRTAAACSPDDPNDVVSQQQQHDLYTFADIPAKRGAVASGPSRRMSGGIENATAVTSDYDSETSDSWVDAHPAEVHSAPPRHEMIGNVRKIHIEASSFEDADDTDRDQVNHRGEALRATQSAGQQSAVSGSDVRLESVVSHTTSAAVAASGGGGRRAWRSKAKTSAPSPSSGKQPATPPVTTMPGAPSSPPSEAAPSSIPVSQRLKKQQLLQRHKKTVSRSKLIDSARLA